MKLTSIIFTSIALILIMGVIYISVADINITQTTINKNIEPAEK